MFPTRKYWNWEIEAFRLCRIFSNLLIVHCVGIVDRMIYNSRTSKCNAIVCCMRSNDNTMGITFLIVAKCEEASTYRTSDGDTRSVL
jgi:hypothetical protein